MTKPPWLAASLFLLLPILACAAGYKGPEPSIRDFVHTAWTQYDGKPIASVFLFEPTSDGYLAFSSGDEGLVQFDGVRFLPIPSPCATRIADATGDRAEGFWMACDSQLYHRDASGSTVEIGHNLLPQNFPVNGFFTDSHKRFWFWGRSLTVLQPDGSGAVEIRGLERSGGESPPARIVEDRDGTIWFAGKQGLFMVRKERAERFWTGPVLGLAPSLGGGVEFSTNTAIARVRNGIVSNLVRFPPGMAPSGGPALAETAAGIWFGTRNQGVALLHNGKIDTFGRRDGLSSDSVLSIKLDREGNVWVGTILGLHRFREPLAYLMSEHDGLPPGMPSFIFRDHADAFWFGTPNEVRRMDRTSGEIRSWPGEYDSIGEDQSRVWLANADQLRYFDRGRLAFAAGEDGKAIGSVNAFFRDNSGHLWALSTTALYRIEGTQVRRIVSGDFGIRFLVSSMSGTWISLSRSGLMHIDHDRGTIAGPGSGVADGIVLAITEDQDTIWVGAREGLSRWRNGKWTTWTSAQGLPGRGVFEITADAQGRLWLMTYGGILALEKANLAAMPDGQPGALSYLQIGALDRVMPHRGGLRFSPRIAKGADGKLYFDTMDAVAVVDPTRIALASLAPRVVIGDFLVNRRSVPKDGVLRFVRPRDIQFEYGSVGLSAPENVRFRYMLDGHDHDWVDAGSQRRAAYGSLQPGNYRFRLKGYAGAGGWISQESSLAFEVTAPFYQRMPFLLACATAFSSLLWITHRYRLRIESNRVRILAETQTDERLRIARDMHGTFLQGVHGSQLMVGAAVDALETEPAESRRLLERAIELIGESAERARETVFALRTQPARPQSFIERLRRIVQKESVFVVDSAKVSLESDGKPFDLMPDVEEHVCHIACEALRNALRHACASVIRIKVCFTPADFRLLVQDDGIGMSAAVRQLGRNEHFGLEGMRERAKKISALLSIESVQGQGTEVRIILARPG